MENTLSEVNNGQPASVAPVAALSAYCSWSSDPATTPVVPCRSATVNEAWTPAAGWVSLAGSVTRVVHNGAPDAA